MSHYIVTGASGGLGRVVVSTLQQRGWNVVGLTSADGDLTDATIAANLIQKHSEGLSGLVHLAGGIIAGAPLEELKLDDLHRMYQLNVVTTFNVLSAALPIMKGQGAGSIVTIGSQSVVHPVANRAAYASMKAAVVAMTQAVAEEGRAHQVRANVILPSIIRTEANLLWADEVESKGWPTPEQISRTIADLLDPASAVSGAAIPIFGTIPF